LLSLSPFAANVVLKLSDQREDAHDHPPNAGGRVDQGILDHLAAKLKVSGTRCFSHAQENKGF
jgi:hypothetical protein